MKSQQLKAFIHSYIGEQGGNAAHSLQNFMERYSKHFRVDISYLDTSSYYIRLSENTPIDTSKREITFDILLHGIEQKYIDNESIDSHREDIASPDKLKLTPKQIITGVLIVIISSILLGIIAVYS